MSKRADKKREAKRAKRKQASARKPSGGRPGLASSLPDVAAPERPPRDTNPPDDVDRTFEAARNANRRRSWAPTA